MKLGGGPRGGSNHHHRRFSSKYLLWVLEIAALALTLLILYRSAYPLLFFQTSLSNISSLDGKNAELEKVLKEAAMKDKTVILTPLNQAWAEPNSVFDIFLEGFKMNDETKKLLNNLVVMSLDGQAYARCVAIHQHCYNLATNETENIGEAKFMSPEYLSMVWRKIDFLRTVLELGYNFIFTDTDIIWFRSPFPHFYPDADFQVSCDHFGGNPSDLISNRPNTGYHYVKSNIRTLEFYNFWYNSRETYPTLHDQHVLKMIQIKNATYLSEIGMNIKFLDTTYFGGFCEPSKDLNQVCTMHANCCTHLDDKIIDLKNLLDDWRRYLSAKENSIASLESSSWTAPQRCAKWITHNRP